MGTNVRLAVVMDPIEHIKYAKDTTLAMLLAAQSRELDKEKRKKIVWDIERLLVDDAARYPALSAHAARCEALPPFREIAQPLAPPSGD